MGATQDDLPDPPKLSAFPDEAHVEFVMSMCKTCGENGAWVQTVRDGNGRITQYNMWDVHHSVQTEHNKFHHFTLTRSNARVS